MAKIDRYNGNLRAFASDAIGTERTLFGEVTQANDLTSQFTADFLRGWGIVGPSDQPTLEDFNAATYTNGQLSAYLHQIGIAEYNALQEYHLGSLCNVAGVVYSSLINANVGNTPASSPAQWKELYGQATETIRGTAEVATSAEALAGVDDATMMTPLKTKTVLNAYTPPDATTTVKGIARFGTPAEQLAGALSTVLSNPAGVLALITAMFPKRVFAANDSIRIPDVAGGLLIQWGTMTTVSTDSGGTLFSYPTVFPNSVLAVFATPRGVAGGSESPEYYSVTNTNARILSVKGDGTALNSTMNWLAIGY